MQKTMQALVKKYPKPGLWLDEVPVPEVGINDVLIKVHKTAICGTDLHIWDWNAWAQKTTTPEPKTSSVKPHALWPAHLRVYRAQSVAWNIHCIECSPNT